jgi:hypothetical protein
MAIVRQNLEVGAARWGPKEGLEICSLSQWTDVQMLEVHSAERCHRPAVFCNNDALAACGSGDQCRKVSLQLVN